MNYHRLTITCASGVSLDVYMYVYRLSFIRIASITVRRLDNCFIWMMVIPPAVSSLFTLPPTLPLLNLLTPNPTAGGSSRGRTAGEDLRLWELWEDMDESRVLSSSGQWPVTVVSPLGVTHDWFSLPLRKAGADSTGVRAWGDSGSRPLLCGVRSLGSVLAKAFITSSMNEGPKSRVDCNTKDISWLSTTLIQ